MHLKQSLIAFSLCLFTLNAVSQEVSDIEFESSDEYSTSEEFLVLSHRAPTHKKLPNGKYEIFDADILALNDEIKAILDQQIRPISSRSKKAHELHKLLFTSSGLGIDYDFSMTKTAIDTYDSGAGNCISHASLYVASARYLGLKANFQTVDVPQEWQKQEGYYTVPGHINAVIDLPGGWHATAEFVDTYIDKDAKATVISDQRALAEYFNNLGMEALEDGNRALAIAFLLKSIDADSKVDFVWSNLGVLYKQKGELAKAEHAYRKALKIKKRNLSTVKNLYLVLLEQNKFKQAAKLSKKVQRYSEKNPFYIAKLADLSYNYGNYGEAISLYEKAIKMQPMVDSFHHGIALAFFKKGKLEESKKHMMLAKTLVDQKQLINESLRYKGKIKAIIAHHEKQ